MKREPKKPKNPLFPENADLKTDSLHSEQTAEEQISAYWEKNQSSILTAIAIAAIVIVGFQGYKIMQAQAEEELQSAYREASDAGSLDAFIDSYSETTLAGFAALESAHLAYAEEDYATALELYEKAARALPENPMLGKARLGIAFAHYQIDSAKGLSLLDSLLADSTLLDSVRTEAAYVLAAHAKTEGDLEKAKSYAEMVQSFENAGSWSFRINQFL